MNLSHKVENPSNSLAKWMEHSEKEKYLTLLQESLAEVEGYLKSSEDAAAAVAPDKGLGRLSRMEAMQDQQMVLELRRRKKRQLLEVGNALKRIEQGSFGKCIFCGKEISYERLEAFPEVQTCMSCA